ncbi:MAG: M16 family metallopeptidase, partial [Limisphaerales bacterium]
ILAMNQTYAGTPDFYKVTLNNFRTATAKEVQSAAKKWLSDGVYILEVHPFPSYQTAKSEVDRSTLPVPTITPNVNFPKLQRTQLSNGLKVVLAERHAVPLINFTLQVDAGYAADQFAVPGTARLAMNMLDEGTKRRTALQISDELDRLGASLNTGSDLDTSTVSLSALKANLDGSLDIFADVILNPSFPAADFERLKKQQLDSIQREKSEPSNMALRILPELLYGDKHAYSTPFTGSGTTEAVSKLTREDAEKFYRTWFKPNNATLIIVGDTKLSEVVPKLEKLFANWQSGSVPKKNYSDVEQGKESVIYLLDRPGSIQSMIFAGHLAPPKANPDEIAIETVNNILGGTFTSRVNMNLREDKHWSYGVRSSLVPAQAQRPFLVVAPVQSDKTKESIQELNKELRGIIGEQPITPEELNKAQQSQTLKLPGTWETIGRIEGSVSEIVRFGLPDNYFETYPDHVFALTTDRLRSTAAKVIHPDRLTWVVVGDRAKIESSLRELGIGEIRLIDADGNVLNR